MFIIMTAITGYICTCLVVLPSLLAIVVLLAGTPSTRPSQLTARQVNIHAERFVASASPPLRFHVHAVVITWVLRAEGVPNRSPEFP